MGALASLSTTNLSVEPGEEVSTELRIANNGDVVDEFTVEALGDAAHWIGSTPPAVTLFPGDDQFVTVRFAPPRDPTATPGPTPFALKVASREDPAGSIVEEGTLVVGAFDERSIELHPTTVTGRFGARYELAIDNRGNQPIDVALAGSDPQAGCDYRFADDVVTVAAGTAVFTKLRVRPRTRIWKGASAPHQFQVLASNAIDTTILLTDDPPGETPADGQPLPAPVVPSETADDDLHAPMLAPGTYVQQAILPPWIVKAVLLTIAALVLLWILWKTLLQPTVESSARDAVAEPLAELEERVEDVEEVLPDIEPPAVEAPVEQDPGGGDDPAGSGEDAGEGDGPGDGEGAGEGEVAGDGDGEPSEPAADPPTAEILFATPFGDPVDMQLGAQVAAGSNDEFVEPIASEFAMTDMVIQNPAGDTGTVSIFRGADRIFVSALENFRDLDRHFVAPYLFAPGEDLQMAITCVTPADGVNCDVSASFAGFAK